MAGQLSTGLDAPGAHGYSGAMDSPRFLTGQLLLAMPGIGDPRFERAVIAVCAHDEQGALGVGIGAVIEGLGLHDVLDQFEIDRGSAPDSPVHFGGPVEPTRGFVIHSNDWSGQDSIDVAGRWALTGTVDILRAIAAGNGPARWLVALGYAGWEAGQLDGEMLRHGWFSTPGEIATIYDQHVDRWADSFMQAGVDPRLLSPQGGTA